MMERRPRGPRITVNVTEEVIRNSVRANSSHCMISEAIKLVMPEWSYVSTDLQTIRASNLEKRHRYVYLTPRKAQEALVMYDAGTEMQPFSFQLRDAQVTQVTNSRRSAVARKPVSTKRAKDLNLLKKAALVGGRRAGNKSSGSPPVRIGGKTPPRLPHTRREFGLRAFGVTFNLGNGEQHVRAAKKQPRTK